jgi:hypothetical protein
MIAPRVYVAAPLAFALKAQAFAEALRALGCWVTSRWHALVGVDAVESLDPEVRARALAMNVYDLDLANALVLFANEGTPRSSLIECGWALASGYPVVWVHAPGAPPLFADHHQVTRFAGAPAPEVVLATITRALNEHRRRPPQHVGINGSARLLEVLSTIPAPPFEVDEPARGDGETVVREFSDEHVDELARDESAHDVDRKGAA